ncbi:MAG TPA: nuclear transport factor 2 family protein [Candidatus Angelobacter sp.]|jgi:hypothetical protein
MALVVLLALLAPAAYAQANRAETELTLRQLEQDLVTAAATNDWRFWDQTVAPEWTCIDQFGRQWDKPTILAGLKNLKASPQSAKLYNVQIRFLKDDVAMATGTAVVTVSLQGKTVKTTFLSTDILMQKQGKWLVVASLATPIKQAS